MSGIQTIFTRDTGPDEPARGQCTADHPDGGKCCESLTAEMDRCPVCGTCTVFRYSKIWKRLFCNDEIKTPFQAQAAYFKAREVDARTPKTALGKRLLEPEVIGKDKWGRAIARFKTKADAARWRRIEKDMNRSEIGEVVNRCRKWMDDKGHQLQGYGLLNYILNACDKHIRERPVKAEKKSAFEGLQNED